MNVTAEMIQEAYNNQRQAMEAMQTARVQLIQAKNTLDHKLAEALMSGEVEGKNQQQRDANARLLLQVSYDAVEQAEVADAEARHQLALADNRVSEVRALLRLDELLAGRSSD